MSVLADFHPLPGEALHRRARRWALAALIAVVVTLPCIIFIKPLWSQLITLGSGTFMLAAGASHALGVYDPATGQLTGLTVSIPGAGGVVGR